VKAEGKLGYIAGGRSEGPPAIGKTQPKTRLCRNKQLELFNKYLDDTAYDHLRDWWDGLKDETPVRKRKPFLRVPLPKLLASRVSARLTGSEVFPEISIEDDPESEYYFKLVQRTSIVQAAMVSASKSLTVNGSVFVRFFVVGNKFMVEHYNSNYCYPEFDAAGELAAVRVQYVFTDNSDLDAYGKPKRKWFRAEFGSVVDVLFDNPEYDQDSEPLFQVVQQIEHGLGFVQGEWFKTGNLPNTDDGPSIMEDMIPFLDAMNYSLSLSQESTDYNTAPQLGIKGMDEDEIDTLIRSNAKAWAMGREGDARFIESNLGGVETSINLRDKNRQVIQDVTRVILLDPEKIAGSAQSGKAMEILHGPMVELINELRPQFGLHLKSLIMKMAIANLIALRMSGVAPVMVPPGWVPMTPDFTLEWPPVFPLTTADLQQEVSLVSSAVSGNLISRRTGVKRLAKYFGVEDIEAELNEIVNQPQLSSPFGMF
jgi:hypothetical protein